jgi:hypothetical protein
MNSGAQQGAAFYCLNTEDGDPSDALLARFAGHRPVTLKMSSCNESAQGVTARGFTGLGLVIRISSITLEGFDRATAEGGYFEAGLSSSGNVYELERRSDGWHVISDRMMWISAAPRPSGLGAFTELRSLCSTEPWRTC